MDKIQRYSRVFRYGCMITMLLLALTICVYWYWMPASQGVSGLFRVSLIPDAVKILYKVTAHVRWLGLMISFINYSLVFLIFFYLTRLLTLFEKNQIFVIESVRYIRKISISLILLQLVLNPLSEAVMTYLLALGNPAGHRVIVITADGTNFALVITAVIILFVSFIMREGCRLQDEVDHTV